MSIVDLPLFVILIFGTKSFSLPMTQFPYLSHGLMGDSLGQAYMGAQWTAKAHTLS